MSPTRSQTPSPLTACGQLTLHTCISLLLTTVVASLLLALGGLWLSNTRDSIHEEIYAATRVCEQWLNVLARQARTAMTDAARETLLSQVKSVGRIRANALEVMDHDWRADLPVPAAHLQNRSSLPRLVCPHRRACV